MQRMLRYLKVIIFHKNLWMYFYYMYDSKINLICENKIDM